MIFSILDYLLAANLISYLVDQPPDMVLDIFPLSIEVVNDNYLVTFLTNSEAISKFIEAGKTEGLDLRVLSVSKQDYR